MCYTANLVEAQLERQALLMCVWVLRRQRRAIDVEQHKGAMICYDHSALAVQLL